jgi:hypothetical protein
VTSPSRLLSGIYVVLALLYGLFLVPATFSLFIVGATFCLIAVALVAVASAMLDSLRSFKSGE